MGAGGCKCELKRNEHREKSRKNLRRKPHMPKRRMREDAKKERARLWKPLLDDAEGPLPISAAERALHPRFPSAKLFAFERTAERNRLIY